MKFNVEQMPAWILIFISITLSAMDMLGIIDNITWLRGRQSSLTLLVLALITFYLITDSSKRTTDLERLRDSVTESGSTTIAALGGVNVKQLKTTREGFDYLIRRYAEAKHYVAHAGLAPSLLDDPSHYEAYSRAISSLVSNRDIKYRYLSLLAKKRWLLIKEILNVEPSVDSHLRYYDEIENITPVLSFSLIDHKEVIVRYPYHPSEPGNWLSITHPDIVGLFGKYYESLWSGAKPISKDDVALIKQLDNKFSSS